MKVNQISGALVAALLAVLVTACGSNETTTAAPSPSPGEPADGGQADGGQEEEITPGGIAVIVLDHLGRDRVRQVVTFRGEDEEGSVGVMLRLRDRTPHNFGVSVYPPEQAEELGAPEGCPPKRDRGGESSRCRVRADGTIVMTSQIAEGFSDDNRKGSVIMSSVITREDGAAMAMYESYDRSPTISAAELEDMLTDPRLTWLTDPALNKAGEAVDLKEVSG